MYTYFNAVESPPGKALNQILSLAAMLVNCVLGYSHSLNTWKRSWQIKAPRSGVIWRCLLMCAAWQESRMNPLLRHRGYFFTVRHWRWPCNCRKTLCRLGLCTFSLMHVGSRKQGSYGVFWPSWSSVRAQHQWDIPLSSSVLTFCSHLRFKSRLKIWYREDASVLAYFSHQIRYLFPQNGKLLAIPCPGMAGELCQEARNVREHAGNHWFSPLLCLLVMQGGPASCQWSGTSTLGAKCKSKVEVERRWVVSWEEHPQRQPSYREGLSLGPVKECSH